MRYGGKMFDYQSNEINLLNWRQQHYANRVRILIILLLLLLILSIAGWFSLLHDTRQQSQEYILLDQQRQQLVTQLQQLESAQQKQRQLLSHQLQLAKVPLQDIVHFVQSLTQIPLDKGRLLLAQIDISPFAIEQKEKLSFLMMGENVDQQTFYRLQQYLLSHWPYPIELEPSALTQNQQKQYNFTLRFNKKEDN